MDREPRRIVVLGSTGSIGQSALEVIEASPLSFQLVGITVHRQVERAIEQCWRHRPRWLVLTDEDGSVEVDSSQLPPETAVSRGVEAMVDMIHQPDVDVVLSAIVGSAGLRGSWEALLAGKQLALANKETLVIAGPMIMERVRQRQGVLVPVDSEHSALFQILHPNDGSSRVERLLLTASGGPFLRLSRENLKQVTVEQALQHPTWNMGAKITIDSATMLNKGLEIIEARWLFDMPPEKIGVVIHPQSIVHSMVEFADGSVMAQLSPPDMKLPIQYALAYPERVDGVACRMDWRQIHQLTFEPPDFERFPALGLGLEVAETGGTAGAILNAAKEAAVDALLNGKLAFYQIVTVCRQVLDHHTFDPSPTLEQLLQADAWARQEVQRWKT